MKSKTAMSFSGILLLAGAAYAQETRTELKRAGLTGTNMRSAAEAMDVPRRASACQTSLRLWFSAL